MATAMQVIADVVKLTVYLTTRSYRRRVAKGLRQPSWRHGATRTQAGEMGRGMGDERLPP
jgi:hypothetical protein